jgi:hypothetical protein
MGVQTYLDIQFPYIGEESFDSILIFPFVK